MALTRITSDGITDGTITGTDLATNIDLVDNQKLRLGTGNDLQIYHDGYNSFLTTDTGNLYIQGDSSSTTEEILIRPKGGEQSARFIANGAVELYYDNEKTFETIQHGIQITDNDTSVQINMVNSNGTIGYLYGGASGDFGLLDGQGHYTVKGIQDGAVELYHDNSKKFETTSTGVHILGTLEGDNLKASNPGNNALLIQNPSNGIIGFGANNQTNQVTISTDGHLGIPSDSGRLRLGASEDLQIYHNGSTNIIEGLNGNLSIRPKTGENGILIRNNDAVELYYDDVLQVKTTSTGITLGDNKRIDLGTGSDLQIYHDGTGCNIRSTSSKLEIRSPDLILQNSAAEKYFRGISDGAVELYYDNSKKLETTSGGVNVTGALTVNGSALTSATNSPAFSAYRSSNYSPSNGSEEVIDFDQERFDTDSCYNFNNGKFTPTTAGNYQFNLNFFWSGTSSNKIKQAHGFIRKNGSENIGQFWHDANDSYKENRQGVSVSTIVAMNGSSDYVEAIGYCLVDSGSPNFNAQGATFSGFKLA